MSYKTNLPGMYTLYVWPNEARLDGEKRETNLTYNEAVTRQRAWHEDGKTVTQIVRQT